MTMHSPPILPLPPRSWSGPAAPESATRLVSVPDLARSAVRLLDAYVVASDAAVDRANEAQPLGAYAVEIRGLLAKLSRAFEALDDHLTGEHAGVWMRRADCARLGLVRADAWSVELDQIAHEYEGARSTEPGHA